MPGELFIVSKCVLLIIVISIVVFWPNEIITDRGDFDIIADKYLTILSVEEGLNEANRTKLIEELENEGFKNITVTAPISAEWGDEVMLNVIVHKTYDKLSGMDYREETKKMEYSNSTIVSGLGNGS